MGANYQKQMVDRVSGMVYAYDYAVKHGLDALKKSCSFAGQPICRWRLIQSDAIRFLRMHLQKFIMRTMWLVSKCCMTNTILQEKD